ncbi:MAG: peptidyl-prolyl cis-trans isomerase [Holophagaceae bacterium]|nr:peptidyl-prolyl cis-trans isomerase [Holophagaceae bacterium]
MRRRALLASILLAATAAFPQGAGPASEAGPKAASARPAEPKPRVKFVTSYGTFVVELEPGLAPKTVANFLAYVKAGHYAGTIFHRVVAGFMIQGGGLTEAMVEKPTLPPVRNEADLTARAGLKNDKGTLAMARVSEPHSATAQFYINTVDNASLDHQAPTDEGYGYCAFGRVVSGMETVEAIEKVRTGWKRGQPNVPEYAVRIKSAELLNP